MNKNGFTLLEVLVAGFILFISITTATVVFSSAKKSNQVATSTIKVAGYVPLIRDHIKTTLTTETKPTSGEGYFMGLEYSWNAKLSDNRPAKSSFSVEGGVLNTNSRLINLWKVNLVVKEKERESDYAFFVTGWD